MAAVAWLAGAVACVPSEPRLPPPGSPDLPDGPEAFLDCLEQPRYSQRGKERFLCDVIPVKRSCSSWTYMQGVECGYEGFSERHEQDTAWVLMASFWRDTDCRLGQADAVRDDTLAPAFPAEAVPKLVQSQGARSLRYLVQGCGHERRYDCRDTRFPSDCQPAASKDAWHAALTEARALLRCPTAVLVEPSKDEPSEGHRRLYLDGCGAVVPVICGLGDDGVAHTGACETAAATPEDFEQSRKLALDLYRESARCSSPDDAVMTMMPIDYDREGGWAQRWTGTGCVGEAAVVCEKRHLTSGRVHCRLLPVPGEMKSGELAIPPALELARRAHPGCVFHPQAAHVVVDGVVRRVQAGGQCGDSWREVDVLCTTRLLEPHHRCQPDDERTRERERAAEAAQKAHAEVASCARQQVRVDHLSRLGPGRYLVRVVGCKVRGGFECREAGEGGTMSCKPE